MKGISCYNILLRPLHRLLIYVVLPILFLVAQAVVIMELKIHRPQGLEAWTMIAWIGMTFASVIVWVIEDYISFPGVYRKQLAGLDMMRASDKGRMLFEGAIRADALFKIMWFVLVFLCLYVEAYIMGVGVVNLHIVKAILFCMFAGYAGTIISNFVCRHFSDMLMIVLMNYIIYSVISPILMLAGVADVLNAAFQWAVFAGVVLASVAFTIFSLYWVKNRYDKYWYRD